MDTPKTLTAKSITHHVCYVQAISIFTQCHMQVTDQIMRENSSTKYEDIFFNRKYRKCIDEHTLHYKECMKGK